MTTEIIENSVSSGKDWEILMGLSVSELLFYLGIALMLFTVFVTIICIIGFRISGEKIKKKLESEYGKPQGYKL